MSPPFAECYPNAASLICRSSHAETPAATAGVVYRAAGSPNQLK